MVSHSAYIHPELLGPMSSSLDAGKSPLALLEKTCHNIGLPDPPKGKSTILPASEKSDKHSTTVLPPSKKTTTKSSPSLLEQKRKASRSIGDEESPAKSARITASPDRPLSEGDVKVDENANTRTESRVPSADSTKRSGSRSTSAPTVSAAQPVPPTIPSLPSSARAPPIPTFPGSSFGAFSAFPHFPGTSSLGHGLPFPPTSSFGHPGAFNPLAFPRMMCTDPNCKSCPPSPLLPRSCPAGCTQCSHPDLSTWLHYSSIIHGLQPSSFFSGLGLSSMASLPSTLSGPTVSTAAGGAHLHLCNWVTPEGVCGKRFANSEELLLHVQTHTKQQERGTSLLNLSSPPSFPPAGRSLSPRSLYLSSVQRFGSSYPKLSPSSPHLPQAYAGAFGGNGYSAALSAALCAGQRLPGSLPHA